MTFTDEMVCCLGLLQTNGVAGEEGRGKVDGGKDETRLAQS